MECKNRLWYAAAAVITMMVLFVMLSGPVAAYADSPETEADASTGVLTIQKQVSHPYGDDYIMPAVSSGYRIDLGPANADKTFGRFTTDKDGVIEPVSVNTSAPVSILDIPAGTKVTVTEISQTSGFSQAEPQSVVMGQENEILVMSSTYTPTEAKADDIKVGGTVTLKGRYWQTGDRFQFALESWKYNQSTSKWEYIVENRITVSSKDGDKDDAATFDLTRDFQESIRRNPLNKPGIYRYRIRQILPEEAAGTGLLDQTEGRFEILVTDKTMDGALEIQQIRGYRGAVVKDNQIQAEFTNRYDNSGAVILQIKKTLKDPSGQNRKPEGFVYEIYKYGQTDNTPAYVSDRTDSSGETAIVIPVEGNSSGGTLTQYILKEKTAGQARMTGGDKTVEFQVTAVRTDAGLTVADIRTCQNGEAVEVSGQLNGTLQVNMEGSYEPVAAELPMKITGSTVVQGRSQTEGEFSVQIFKTDSSYRLAEDAKPMSTVRTTLGTAEQNSSHLRSSFTFDKMTFTTVGWHYYLIRQDKAQAPVGIVCDPIEYYLSILVEDGGKGGLVVSEQGTSLRTSEGTVAANVVFNNRYQPVSTYFAVTGQTTLDGRQLQPEEFGIRLYLAEYENGTFVRNQWWGRTVNDLKSTAPAAGDFIFEILYENTGVFHYILSEEIPYEGEQEAGMAYDSSLYGIEVTVTDDLSGRLQAEITKLEKLNSGGDTKVEGIHFHNTFTPEAAVPDTAPTEEPAAEEEALAQKAPQAKPLWWPAVLLLIAGVALVLIGLIPRRGAGYEN